MAKNAYTKSSMDTNITILALDNNKKLMDSVNVQIYQIDIGKLIFVKKKMILIEILRKLFFTCTSFV